MQPADLDITNGQGVNNAWFVINPESVQAATISVNATSPTATSSVPPATITAPTGGGGEYSVQADDTPDPGCR